MVSFFNFWKVETSTGACSPQRCALGDPGLCGRQLRIPRLQGLHADLHLISARSHRIFTMSTSWTCNAFSRLLAFWRTGSNFLWKASCEAAPGVVVGGTFSHTAACEASTVTSLRKDFKRRTARVHGDSAHSSRSFHQFQVLPQRLPILL